MSVSKWNYDPDKCDGQPCIGDCDLCNREVEQDITWELNDETISDTSKILQAVPSSTRACGKDSE